MVVFGTRPEAIKLAPVIMGLREHPNLRCCVCVTAQHREMLDQALTIFDIIPNIDLDLMYPGQDLPTLTARTVSALNEVFLRERPDLILVQGDTTTVFCAALAAFYCHIPVGHVEAGLRTGDLEAPWPEEANRTLTSRITRLHFAPTEWSRQNLLREGIPESSIFLTGNTVVDALLYALKTTAGSLTSVPQIAGLMSLSPGCRIVLITGHRRESFGDGFEAICHAIGDLAERFPEIHFVYPVHLNPNVREPVERILGTHSRPNVHLLDPLPYVAFVQLMNRAYLVLTDSGGIQEEAPSLGKPVLIMRDKTERPEGIAAGTARLVGTSRDRIVDEVSWLILDHARYEKMAKAHNPFGDGRASHRIIEVCERFLGYSRYPAADVTRI